MLFVPRRWRKLGTPLVGRDVELFYLVLSTPVGAGVLARTLTGSTSRLRLPIRRAARAWSSSSDPGSMNLRAGGRQLSSVTMEAGLRVLEAARLFDR